MKKTLLFASSAVLAFSAASAFAGPAVSGMVFGANLGYANIDTFTNTAGLVDEVTGAPANLDAKTGSFSWGLNGGYNFAVNPNVLVGGQIGYNDFGSTKYTSSTNSFNISSRAWDLLATGGYVFNNGINLFAKAGAAYVTQSADVSGIDNNSQIRPEVGVGAGYMFNNMNFTVEYRHIFGKNQKDIEDTFNNQGQFDSIASVNAVYFGVAYQLPF